MLNQKRPAYVGLERRLTIRQLRAAVAIVEEGGVLAAAKTLGVSQPALTRTLHELEGLFGLSLFNRHARGVTPTEYGIVLAQMGQRVLADIFKLESEISTLVARNAGSLSVGTLPNAAAGLMTGVSLHVHETRPTLEIQHVQGQFDHMLQALRSNMIEILIGRFYCPDADNEFVKIALYNEPLNFLAREGHPLSGGVRLNASTLHSYRLILPTLGQRVGHEIEAWLGDLNISSATALRTTSSSVMREMLLGSDDLLVMPALMLAGDIMRGAITRIQAPLPSPIRPGGVIHRPGKELSEQARHFISILKEKIRKLAETGIVEVR